MTVRRWVADQMAAALYPSGRSARRCGSPADRRPRSQSFYLKSLYSRTGLCRTNRPGRIAPSSCQKSGPGHSRSWQGFGPGHYLEARPGPPSLEMLRSQSWGWVRQGCRSYLFFADSNLVVDFDRAGCSQKPDPVPFEQPPHLQSGRPRR